MFTLLPSLYPVFSQYLVCLIILKQPTLQNTVMHDNKFGNNAWSKHKYGHFQKPNVSENNRLV